MIDYKKLRTKSRKISDKYPNDMPEKVEKEFRAIGKQLDENASKIIDELLELWTNGKTSINKKELSNIVTKIDFREYLSLDEIPELENEIDKVIMLNRQNDLICQIPDDKYTKEEIEKIIEYIINNTITSEEKMPYSTKKQPKVKLQDILLDKMNTKREL